MKKLVIAIIAQPSRKVPPFYGYGGAQRGFYDLIEELKNLGHEIVLFAPRDSETSADRLISPIRGINDPPPITDKRKRKEMIDKHRNKIIEVLLEEPDIDIINLRWDDLEILDFVKDLDTPMLHSLHNSAS
ncbi:MAG: glycosyltransferase, partial [Chloroflexota bacterium]|nr:glycosyltransferase [Chloroflexota bacterium]